MTTAASSPALRRGWAGATHFLIKTLPRVAAEMALHVLAYNLTRVINIINVQPLLAAVTA
jgi:transposase